MSAVMWTVTATVDTRSKRPGASGTTDIWLGACPLKPPCCMQPVDGQLGVGKLTTPDLFGPLKGLSIINLKDQIDNGDLIYLVILTKDHPNGEMRGQLGAAEPPLVAG